MFEKEKSILYTSKNVPIIHQQDDFDDIFKRFYNFQFKKK